MRVISGKCRGLKLLSPVTCDTRPTADRVKEAVFSIISHDISDSYVLDIFGGSGALVIEALSRGAKYGYINDSNKRSVDVIKKNIILTNMQKYVTICNKDYLRFLTDLNDIQFDIIFLDPPYKSNYGKVCLEYISKNKLLSKTGLIVFETDKDFLEKIEDLILVTTKKYGSTFIKIYKWR
ncbi:MAG: 16S rRNA (guanine(966)-N(2))-methyltransferase RsmD [Clostridia bacterium]